MRRPTPAGGGPPSERSPEGEGSRGTAAGHRPGRLVRMTASPDATPGDCRCKGVVVAHSRAPCPGSPRREPREWRSVSGGATRIPSACASGFPATGHDGRRTLRQRGASLEACACGLWSQRPDATVGGPPSERSPEGEGSRGTAAGHRPGRLVVRATGARSGRRRGCRSPRPAGVPGPSPSPRRAPARPRACGCGPQACRSCR